MSEVATAPRLSIVIVSWQPGRELVACVESLAAARRLAAFEAELVIVDNASADFPAPAVAAVWPGARLIRNETNRGFGPAANQGVAAATGEVVLLLNPDTEALDDPFTGILEAFAAHPEAVAIAPGLDAPGTEGAEVQGTFQLRHLPTWPQAVRELLLLDKACPKSRALRRERYVDRDRGQHFAVEQPAAAALAVRRGTFAGVGGFDESFVPAWFEDVDLCARLLREGTILYWPKSRFRHAGGSAVRVLGYPRFLAIYYRNACRYWRKHHGPTAAFGFRLLVATGMVLRLLVVPLGLALPNSRLEAALAYLAVIRVVLVPLPASSAPVRSTGGAR